MGHRIIRIESPCRWPQSRKQDLLPGVVWFRGLQPNIHSVVRGLFTGVISITLDTFDVHMPQLDFFRTQNIFAPGKQMIDIQIPETGAAV